MGFEPVTRIHGFILKDKYYKYNSNKNSNFIFLNILIRNYEKECIFISIVWFNYIEFFIISIFNLSILQIVYFKNIPMVSHMFFVFICLFFFCYLKPDSIPIKSLLNFYDYKIIFIQLLDF
jgi:hypothetical protein